MQNVVLQLDRKDNVLIALADLNRGQQVPFEGGNVTLLSGVPAKHKFAAEDLGIGDGITMYGLLVGRAVRPIARGERLSTSNVEHDASAFTTPAGEYRWVPPDVSRWKQRTFAGRKLSDLPKSSLYTFPVRPQQIVTLHFATSSALPEPEPIRSWDPFVPEAKLPALHDYDPNLIGHPPFGE